MKQSKSALSFIFANNLLFVNGALLTFFVVCLKNFSDATVFSLSLIFITLISSIVTSIFFQNLKLIFRCIIDFIISAVCYIPVHLIVSNFPTVVSSSVRMFLPALITASVLIYAAVFNSPDVTFSKGTLSVFAMLCGSTTFAVVTAIISDFAISGKFFGVEVFSVKGASSDNNRFVGLIILAFTAALVKHIVDTANRKSGRGRTERKGE